MICIAVKNIRLKLQNQGLICGPFGLWEKKIEILQSK
mgnify:CR=1 FL=1